jgi:hypothetical protein
MTPATPAEIDPEIGISKARPGETSGAASPQHWFGRDHKTKTPFLDHAGKKLRMERFSAIGMTQHSG